MRINLDYFKKILEKEKTKIENQLKRFAKKSNKGDDWQPNPSSEASNIQMAELGEVATAITQMETNLESEKVLESSLKEVNDALERIENGNYGICEKTGEIIKEERLKANPTAKTCVNHS